MINVRRKPMHKDNILWAQAAEEDEIYKVAGVDDQGMLSVVWDPDTGERLQHVLKQMKILLRKYDVDKSSEWWKDLSTCVEFMSFMAPRQREAQKIYEEKKKRLERETDIPMPSQTISSPYCSDEQILGPQHQYWKSFMNKLKGPCGVCFDLEDGRATWHCNHTLTKTKAILCDYESDGIDVTATLDFFKQHGGICDCKVLFDVLENFYKK